MKLSELYSEYFANFISGGNLVNRDKISLLGIRPLFDRFLTNQYITRVWHVSGIPVHYDQNLTQKIRTEMKERHPDVSTIIHMYNMPVNVQVFSDNFVRHMNSSAKQYYQYRDVFESLTEIEQEVGVVERDSAGNKVSIDNFTLERIRDNYDSYMYVHHAASEGKYFMNTYYFVQASSKSKKSMDGYAKDLMNLLRGDEISIVPLRGNVGQYLNNFCPAAFMQSGAGRYRSMLFSQENVAAMMPSVTKGLVGKQGIMLGMNWQTKLPFRLDLTGSGMAQVILIIAKSGWGKTYLAFEIAIELVGFGVHCSVTDIKGSEWRLIAKYVQTLEIDMSGDSARFVNLMRLDDLGCTPDDCVEAYDAAIRDTVGLFEVCTNLQDFEGNKADLRSILNQAVEKVYSTAGVERNNPKTFVYSKSFKYEDVIMNVSTLEHSKSYTTDMQNLCKLIKTRCSSYFMGEGRYSAAFRNELTVAEVLNTPMIIYNFNKNSGEKLDMIDNIRVFMARCLDNRKHFIRKRKGLHQAAFYEELQRCGGMTEFIENISSSVTGSRSNNLSVFLLLNAISTFDADIFAAIRSNITTKIVGLCTTEDITKLQKDYDCKRISHYMNEIYSNEEGKYSHCFAIDYDVGNDRDSLILKTVIPPEMSKDFNTRDVVKIA